MRSAPPTFRIKRGLTHRSKAKLDIKEQLTDQFTDTPFRFRGKRTLSSTLIEEGELKGSLTPQARRLGQVGLARNILLPAPDTSTRLLTLSFSGVDFFGIDQYRKHLVAVLDDPDGILAQERETYSARIDQVTDHHNRWKQIQPHITLASLDINCCIEELREFTEELLPPSVTLQSVKTSPEWISKQLFQPEG